MAKIYVCNSKSHIEVSPRSDTTKYSYYHDIAAKPKYVDLSDSEGINRPCETPRIKNTNTFTFKDIESPEDLHTLYISNFYSMIQTNLCYNFKYLTRVKFDIEIIPRNAFYGCESLQIVTISSKLKFIDTSAFRNCPELTSIKYSDMPDESIIHVDTIGDYAFENCIKFGLPVNYNYCGKASFKNCGYKSLNLTNIKSFGDSCYENNKQLVEVKIFKSTDLSKSMFKDCEKLITFETDATKLNKYTLLNCGFTDLIIPSSILYIDEHAITSNTNNSKLKNVYISNPKLQINYNQSATNKVNVNLNFKSQESKQKQNIIKFLINNEDFIKYNSLFIFKCNDFKNINDNKSYLPIIKNFYLDEITKDIKSHIKRMNNMKNNDDIYMTCTKIINDINCYDELKVEYELYE